MFYLHIIHYIGFIGAQIFNSILALLIVMRAGRLFGPYRHVMLAFTLCSMWFSWVEIITQPVVHMKGPCFVVFMDSTRFSSSIDNFIVCLHCATFGFIISLLVAQYFYRYCVICKPDLLIIFEGSRLGLLFLSSLFVYAFWFELVNLGMPGTIEKREFLQEDFEVLFNLDAEKVAMVGTMYWSTNKNGDREWRLWDITASGFMCCVTGTLCSLILFFAFNIYFFMKNAKAHMSKRTLELNRQLFVMLVVQTVFPFITMYFPLGLLIFLPLINMTFGVYTNYLTANLAVYPMIEPMIAMYCISDFRNFILRILGFSKDSVVADVSVTIDTALVL